MSGPKIVLWDIEIIPNLKEALKMWTSLSAYPGLTLRASITSICCVGWKILGEDKVHCINAWNFPEWLVDVNDDRRVCEAAYEILKDADCFVTHNGARFDLKFLQTRLRYHKLPPLPRIHHVDTCRESKKNLFVLNNRLNTVAKFLTDEEKMENEGWELWIRTHGRDVEAQDIMSRYCQQDVVTLEAVFHELRPLITSLPNANLFNPMKANSCPNCGSTRLQSYGKRYTSTRA